MAEADAGRRAGTRFRGRTALGFVCLALSIVACLLAIASATSPGVPFADWQTYANAFDRFVSGAGLYSPAQLAGPYEMPLTVKSGYSYPPPSILLMWPFVGGAPGLLAWMTVNVAFLWTGLAAVLRRELGWAAPWPLALCLLGLAVFPPFRIGVVDGNVNVALAGLLAWVWADESWRAGVPFVASIAGITKVFPAAIAAWGVRERGVRPVLLTAAAVGAIVLLTLPIVGAESWVDYARAIANAVPACETRFPSIACILEPAVGVAAAKMAGILVGGGLVVAAVVIRDRLLAFTALTAAFVAPVTDIHPHYGLFLYVLLVIVAARLAVRWMTSARRSAGGVPT